MSKKDVQIDQFLQISAFVPLLQWSMLISDWGSIVELHEARDAAGTPAICKISDQLISLDAVVTLVDLFVRYGLEWHSVAVST